MKNPKRKPAWFPFFTAGLLFLTMQGLLAQQPVTGSVTDAATGEGIPGVNVVAKGTTSGTITDLEGNYQLTVSDPETVLVFSYVGFHPQEIPVGSQTRIDVILEEDVLALEEVVVIGYGTVKKEDLTGSVAVVTAEELAKTPSANLSRALQGRASGVMVTQSGSPGAGVTIRVRGIGSINQSPDPLYVVDGVVGAGINDINPNDIESFQVLKDASAAAIYGADGANGVVIVTTKRGKEGKPRVNFSTYGSMNLAPELFELMNADQYVDFYNEIYDDNGIEPPVAYTDEFRQYYYGEGWEEGTDWQQEMLQRAQTQSYYLSVSGGGEASNYSVSANILDEEGILRSTAATRYNLRANSDFRIGKYIKVGETFSLSRNIVYSAGSWQGGAWSSPLIASPLMKVFNENNKGGYDGPQEAVNYPAGESTYFNNTGGNDKPNPRVAADLDDLRTNYNSFLGSAYLEIKPFDWIAYKITPSVIGNFNHTRNWAPSFESGVRDRQLATLDENFSESMNLSLENQLTFSKAFGNHRFTLTGVHHVRRLDIYSSNVRAQNFAYENLNVLHMATDAPVVTGYITPVRWESLLGRIIYDYSGKYLLTASVRRDGNSRFGPGNRYGLFPSASAAWKLNEDLLPDVEAIDMLKLRVGYGKTGNSDIGNFAYESLLSKFTDFSPVLGVSQSVQPALNVLYGFGNELIRWESSAMTNVGMDVSLFRNRLSATAEYYIKNTDNLIVDRSVSMIFARLGQPKVNLGNIQNRGFEFNLSFRDMEGMFRYEITGMLTTIKNEVIDIPETYISGNNIARIGNTVGSLR
ncbi:MAG TPA: SusC/RagA family TonB-linked outer membrane protein, partial [Bacteroides sp.]|nr:SusC/RagA family TonB-linked outer membrane protein [Bacteroides sp.]